LLARQPSSGKDYQLGSNDAAYYLRGVHPLRALLIYLGAIFFGGALLAPWIYRLVQESAAQFQFLETLAHEPFQRFLTRTFLGIALLGLWPFARSLGAHSWREIGLPKPQGQGSKLVGGLALGFGSLAVVAGLVLLAGGRTLDAHRSGHSLMRHLVNAGLAALVVALLEEIIFRGALFGALRKAYHWMIALLLSSAIYALLHFFESPQTMSEAGWASGLELLPRMARGFVNFQAVVPGFFNLTLAGLILGLAYHRFGNLYFSIGLHSGWIFWVKSYGFLTRANPTANTWFWGSRKLVDGWLALIVLILVLVTVGRLTVPRTKTTFP
jgi:membrane protease YdiL (CAAX protease family)